MFEGCAGCTGCPQLIAERDLDLGYAFGGFVLPVEHPGASILAIGDQADYAEYKRGEVFSGMTGYQWHKTLRALNINKKEFSLANMISCLPPKDWKVYKKDAAASEEQCRQYIGRTLQRVNPDVVMTLGAMPTNAFLGDGSLVEHHAPRRGYVFEEAFGSWSGLVVPSVHPRMLGQGKANWTPLLMHDILTARKAVEHGAAWKKYTPEYVEFPTFADIDNFYERACLWLRKHAGDMGMFTCDIETEESGKEEEANYDEITDAEITRVSFAYRPGYAITIPFLPEFYPYIQKLLNIPAKFIVYWNWTFDHPRLLAKGFKITQTILDGMELWHYYKTALPKSLGSVTPNLCPQFGEWKSLFGIDPEFYSCVDSDAAISNTHKTIEKMTKGQLEAFMSHWIGIRPINQAMHEHGALMDMDKHKTLRDILIKDLNLVDDKLQELIPERIKPFKLYKTVPIMFRCRSCAGKGFVVKAKTKTRKKVVVKKWKEVRPCGYCMDLGYIDENIPEPWTHELGGRTGYYMKTSVEMIPKCTGEKVLIGKPNMGPRPCWGFKQKFLPTSPKHVANYLRDCGYPVPRNYLTDKETTDVKAIEALMVKHPKDLTLPQFLEYRQIKKMLGQYIDGYVPWDDGRIHTTFGQKATNLRYNSVKPNVQNVIQKGKYAQLYRQQFIPAPGHVLAELDHSGAEAHIVGFYANDPDYIRIAKLSIHGILASYVLVNEGHWQNPIDLKWSDEDIAEAVNEIKKKFKPQYQRAKNCVHGSNYGAVPYKLFMEYPPSRTSTSRTCTDTASTSGTCCHPTGTATS
jgi:uracil-DNA glycosylase family 4